MGNILFFNTPVIHKQFTSCNFFGLLGSMIQYRDCVIVIIDVNMFMFTFK